MKGGNLQRARGKQFSFTLLAVVCMTVFLWSYERRPVLTNILLSQDNLILPSASHISEDLINPEDVPVQEPRHVNNETEEKTVPQISNIENKEETEERVNPRMSIVENREPAAEESTVTVEDDSDSISSSVQSSSSHNKVCNYAKGRWVVDNRRPLYSGSKCKHWLSEMWAYRWQPANCDMPDFERSSFLKSSE